MYRKFPMLAGLAVALMVAGCGSSDLMRVTGKVLKDGQPFTVAEGQWLQVHLFPIEAGAANPNIYLANIDKDGSFEFPGGEGQGVPKGKYKVTAKLVTYKDRDTDLLKKRFNEENSKIIADANGSTSVTLDLSDAK